MVVLQLSSNSSTLVRISAFMVIDMTKAMKIMRMIPFLNLKLHVGLVIWDRKTLLLKLFLFHCFLEGEQNED